MVVQIEYNWYDDVKSTDHSSNILTFLLSPSRNRHLQVIRLQMS